MTKSSSSRPGPGIVENSKLNATPLGGKSAPGRRILAAWKKKCRKCFLLFKTQTTDLEHIVLLHIGRESGLCEDGGHAQPLDQGGQHHVRPLVHQLLIKTMISLADDEDKEGTPN